MSSSWGSSWTASKGQLIRRSKADDSVISTTVVGPVITETNAGSQISVNSPGPPYTQSNNWVLNRANRRVGRLSGTARSSSFGWYYDVVDYPIVYGSGFTYPATNWSYWATQALSGRNPNKPLIDVPLFVFELKDFPGMLRDLGRVLSNRMRPDDIPGAHLAYQFGWAPLFSDIQTLITLGSQIDSSISKWNSIKNKKRVSGKLESYRQLVGGRSGSYTAPYNMGRASWSFNLYHKRDVWYTAHIGSDFQLPDWSSPVSRARWALGLNASYSTIWNALPWSWLVDYFINISAFLDANRVTPVIMHNMCIMCQDSMEIDKFECSSVYDFSNLEASAPKLADSRKLRQVVANPHARIAWKPNPLFGKLPILTSLITATALRKAR